MRIRVHVLERPRRESTRMSSTCSSAAASGCLAFHRSRPASASFLCSAFATVTSGCVDWRRPVPFSFAAAALRRDGATRGGSPSCFLKCGGHGASPSPARSEEHTSELQSQSNLVCRLLLEKKKKK